MTALMIKAINVPRMTRVTWYRHRTLVLAIAGVFLMAAALLVIDGVLQRHWISSHHFTYCLAYADNATSSRCLTQDAPYQLGIFSEFVNYWRTEGAVAAVFALAAVTGLFAGVPWVAREFESGGFRFTWTQSVSPLRWLLGTFGPPTSRTTTWSGSRSPATASSSRSAPSPSSPRSGGFASTRPNEVGSADGHVPPQPPRLSHLG